MRVFLVAVALLATLMARSAAAENKYLFNIVIVEHAESNVRLFDVHTYSQRGDYYECLSFQNTSAMPLKYVRFRLTYANAAKKVTGFDTIERRGSFDAGGKVEPPVIRSYGMTNFSGVPNCQQFSPPGGDVLYILATVDRAEFADGTIWIDPKPFSGTPAPTSSPSPEPTGSKIWNSSRPTSAR